MWRTALAWLLIAGCIRDVGRGPDLGACAEVPDGVYTWGEIGIGTCLSGPADIRFVEQGARTFLAVSNADPLLNYTSGSILALDWDEVVSRIEADHPERLMVDELNPLALPLLDDDDGDGKGGNPFLGGMGVLPGGQTLLATTRLTEDSVLRSGKDELLVIDISGLDDGEAPTRSSQLVLRDDPYPVVIDDNADRAYVGNLTDHSVSVLDIATAPPVEIDVADGGPLGPVTFEDDDRSGSFAEITELNVEFPADVPNEHFTFTWVDGTTRLWLPTPTDADVVGLKRWTTGGHEVLPSAFGVELVHPGGLTDPFAVNDAGQLALMWYASGGSLFVAQYDATVIEDIWIVFPEQPLLVGGTGGCGSVLGAPTVAVRDGVQSLLFDRRDAVGDDAAIGLATTLDGLIWSCASDPVVAEEGASLEDPFVVFDPRANRYRMWMSRQVGDRWTIALTETDDLEVWDEPVAVVLELPDADIAAPSVEFLNGRYVLWAAMADDGVDGWTHIRSTSFDGRVWSEPEPMVDSEAPFDATAPPRAALQFEGVGAWRVEGRDLGPVDSLFPAGVGTPSLVQGFTVTLANGHEFSNEVVSKGRGAQGITPVSAVEVGGETWVYATATGAAGRDRILAITDRPVTWAVVVAPEDIEEALTSPASGAGAQALHPLVVEDADGFVMFYGLRDATGVTRMHRATSTDGISWQADSEPLLAEEESAFDALTALPHSIETLDDGSVRLWYGGDNSTRFRIGAAVAADLRGTFEREPTPRDDAQFSTGLPGSFDDSGVKDPLVFTVDGTTHMLYSGFDGTFWHLGHAVRDGDEWVRRVDPVADSSLPALSGLTLTFSAAGVESPTLVAIDGDELELLYAGTDGSAARIGRATAQISTLSKTDDRGNPVSTGVVYASQNVPTAGDVLEFDTTRRGDGPDSVIELGQLVEAFVADGTGMTSVTLDEARGFLYVTTKATPIVYVVDVRDDTTGTFTDANFQDLEGILSIQNANASRGIGYWSSALSPSRAQLYLTQRNPDGLVVVDVGTLVDDDTKDVEFSAARAVLPLPDLGQDEGAESLAFIGGAGMALTDDERLLLVTHFRGNSLHVFDLEIGPYGQEIAYLPFLGENPHVVRISPDGRYAVVANYLGDVNDSLTSSTLVVVDLDPTSETYLEAVTWLANL